MWVIRVKISQPDGIGYMGKSGGCYRDRIYAATFKTEEDARMHLIDMEPDCWWDGDDQGPWYWVEEENGK